MVGLFFMSRGEPPTVRLCVLFFCCVKWHHNCIIKNCIKTSISVCIFKNAKKTENFLKRFFNFYGSKLIFADKRNCFFSLHKSTTN